MALNLGELADQVFDLQLQVDKIEAQAKAKADPLKAQIKDLNEQLQHAMIDAGVLSISGTKGAAKIEEKLRIGFADFDAFEQFARRRKVLHLFERRISLNAYRELKEQLGDKPIPGLSEFIQQSCKVTKRK